MTTPAGEMEGGGGGAFAAFAYGCQFLFGGWFLVHGLNYWFEFFLDKSIQPGPGLVPALAESGVMALVKMLEIIIGLSLLFDLYAALAIVAAWPITLMIAFVTSSHLSRFGISVAVVIVALNAIMSLGHLGRYRLMLAAAAGTPRLDSQAYDSERLRWVRHALAAAAGLIAAVAITYLSLVLRR